LKPEQLADRLYSRHDGASFVLPFSWSEAFPFLAPRLLRRAPWISSRSSLSSVFTPLVDTRAHFVALNDHLGFTHDDIGNVRMMITGREQKQ
jgi:hypothetical protein